VSDVLGALRRYADEHDGALACDFELAGAGEGAHLVERFLRDAELAGAFEVFGYDGMLGLYAIWEGAVAYLDADWLQTGVVCESLDEFAALLCLGRERVGALRDWGEGECDGVAEFRAWAEHELGVRTPSEAEARALVERARAAHPDLQAWIEQRRGES
jgi:hypothetical protein